MDPLSDIVALLAPHAVVSKPITGKGAWSVRYAPYGRPGFALVLEGECWLTVEGDSPVQLHGGDFVLLPATPAFALSSKPGMSAADFAPSDKPVHHGEQGGSPDFHMFGGAFAIDQVNASLLIDLLPRMIHVRAGDAGAERLARVVDLVRDECEASRPGGAMVVERLLEVMLVECLRLSGGAQGMARRGLLAGLLDPPLARALRAIHADVRHGWTVAELARVAGMSRSAFAARFREVMRCAPIEYLARWRMALAKDALMRGDRSLERVAEEIGYESASAFSTAFRKRIGSAPGAYARNHSIRHAAAAAGA